VNISELRKSKREVCMSLFSQLKHTSVYAGTKELKKDFLRKLALPRYLGDKHVCPVCDTHLRAFKPIWKSFMRQIDSAHPYQYKSLQTFNWQNYSCPACDASDRERLILLYLNQLSSSFDPHRRYRLVEFAPSPALRRKLKRNPIFEYRSADLYRKTVDDRIDITNMHPYRDESIDVFICSHILEHVIEDRKAIRELYRVLNKDGFGIVIVPLINGMDWTDEDESVNSRESRFLRYGDGDHVRQYGIRDFQDRLKSAGFEIELIGQEFFGAEAFRKAGIVQDSVLYVVRKSGQAGKLP
jgi:predicted SAM-dependent methyltransferase